MDNRRNYYRVLHVQPDAPVELIKASYRTLMHKLKHHPDLGGDHDTAILINEAHEVLTNKVKRAAYDKQLLAQRSKASMGTQSASQRQPKKPQPETPKDTKYDADQAPEERVMPRVKLGALVTYYFEDQPKLKHQGTIIDFSPSGLQIQIEDPVPIHGKIRLKSQQMTARALVSYCKPFGRARWRIGVILLETQYTKRQGGFFSSSA